MEDYFEVGMCGGFSFDEDVQISEARISIKKYFLGTGLSLDDSSINILINRYMTLRSTEKKVDSRTLELLCSGFILGREEERGKNLLTNIRKEKDNRKSIEESKNNLRSIINQRLDKLPIIDDNPPIRENCLENYPLEIAEITMGYPPTILKHYKVYYVFGQSQDRKQIIVSDGILFRRENEDYYVIENRMPLNKDFITRYEVLKDLRKKLDLPSTSRSREGSIC